MGSPPERTSDRARPGMRRSALGRWVSIGLPYGWLLLFFLLPFVIVLQISLAQPLLAQPPYSALLDWTDDAVLQLRLNLANDLLVWHDALYLGALDGEFIKSELERLHPRVAELSFSAERRCMTTLHQNGNSIISFTKGAPEAILPRCTQQLFLDGPNTLEPHAIHVQV